MDLAPARDLADLGDGLVHLQWLLDHAQGLAAVCAAASKQTMLAEQDLTAALEILHGYLLALRLVVEPWGHVSLAHLTGQAPDAEVRHA